VEALFGTELECVVKSRRSESYLLLNVINKVVFFRIPFRSSLCASVPASECASAFVARYGEIRATFWGLVRDRRADRRER